jgi:hypothetical protein
MDGGHLRAPLASQVLALRAAAKGTKIVSFQKRSRRLLAQIELQSKWLSARRDAVESSPVHSM